MPIVFSCFSPHPPLLLPKVGNAKDKKKVEKTIFSLNWLGKKLAEKKPEKIIISSPHPDWGFNVPLFFLANNFNGKIEKYLTGTEPPIFYFEKGKEFYRQKIENSKEKIALIASGDMSHVLKEDGPYGFHSDGPKFDKNFILALKRKNLEKILKLEDIYPESANCGLRSFCFILGILNSFVPNWKAEVLSYEAPFGVGYLTVDFKF